MPIIFIMLFIPLKGLTFLDFVGEQTKKAVEVAAYADAVTDLVEEVHPDSELEDGSRDIKKRSDQIRKSAHELGSLSRATQGVLEGPDWSSRRIETNIRATTNYVRRLKRLLLRVAALGTDGVIALNTTETNVALNEIQKNQQAILMQNASLQILEIEKEQENRRQWSEFSEQQKRLRRKESLRGKL